MATYETHVTVEEHPTLKQAADFASFANSISCKPLLIELSSGSFPLQLMLATRGQRSTDREAVEWGAQLENRVEQAGWKVVRTKVESPLMPGEASYYEAHWKFLLSTEEDHQKWGGFLKQRSGFLASKNLFKEGLFYLSQRVRPAQIDDYSFAQNAFDDGQLCFHADNLHSEGGHYERVLLDTNPALDKGWNVS